MRTRIRSLLRYLFPILGLLCMGHEPPCQAADSQQARELFANPTREFSTGPLWVWNDLLTEDQIRGTLRDLASQQVRQAWVHPRPGLMTPYLGKEWFRLWKIALEEAQRLDMNLWIYDENSYPSGFAGGWVPELMPESRGRGLFLKELTDTPQWRTESLAVYDLGDGYAKNISVQVRADDPFPKGRYLEASVRRAPDSPWHGNRSYVDLLYPGVTEKFLEVTLEAYRREFGSLFGNRVPGVFTDEPEIRPAGGLPWTDDLPEQFERRWGYSLIDHLPGLTLPVGDWRRLRHNFFQTLNELFIERWARPYFDYCERTGLEMTGHYWEHDWPRCLSVPDNMAMYAWQQRPAIDTLMNHYEEDTHAQFGNVRAVRELSSIANQLGLSRTLCELYGAGGWDLRFEDMKRIGDWLQVLGVNTLNEHLSYVTLRGARKRDHPQSFSYHEPWWEAYHVSASYFTRLSVALSHGQQINRVLVLEPTTTAWMHQGDEASLKELGDSFTRVLMDLERAQIEYDLGCEDVIARHGSATSTGLRIGQRTYPIVVLPPRTENINLTTVTLLEKFVANGGRLLACDAPPARLNGEPSDRATAMARQPGWTTVESRKLPELLMEPEATFQITRTPGDSGILFHHRRQFDDGQILFLVNTSNTHPSSGTVQAKAGGIEAWDLRTGEITPHAFESDNGRVQSPFTLPPSGSLLLFLTRRPIDSPQVASLQTVPINAEGPPQVQRLQPNVLTLDFVDITAGGETRTNVYFYEANAWVWRQHGLERNPWDSAVQFEDELISKRFPADSGFSAVYRFTVDGAVPKDLAIVIERPDLYTVECNGNPVAAIPGDWWLDRAFGKLSLVDHARTGANSVRITATPFSMLHELEPAYVVGNFSLRSESSGFVIQPAQAITLGRWDKQGQPFYGHTVSYAETFRIDTPQDRYRVTLGDWLGSVAGVLVNGGHVGYITAPPWECDITHKLQPGTNRVEVVVYGTLKNTLGPHHGNSPLGSAWPSMFQHGPKSGPPPGSEYSTVGYGLFEPFVLKRTLHP
jgi:hypothetical protein